MKFQGQPVVGVDVEYNPETMELFWAGLNFDGEEVWGCPWDHNYAPLVKRIMEDPSTVKVAHNAFAELRAFEKAGVHVKGPLWDTMIAFWALHPGGEVALHHAASYYNTWFQYWKGMSHNDPRYNALDVWHMMGILKGQLAECKRRPVDPTDEIMSRMRLIPVVKAMEDRGIHVDVVKQRELINNCAGEITKLEEGIQAKVAVMWDKRVHSERTKLYEVEQRVEALRSLLKGSCDKHPTYNGVRQPAKKCLVCIDTFAAHGALRDEVAKVTKERTKLKGQVDKWAEGFKATNSHHLQWLLYDPTALHLPVQRGKGAGGKRTITTDAKSIERLSELKSVQRKGEAFKVVKDIKRVQELNKAVSTFLEVEVVDSALKWPHLRYKIHGTETGRLAGGDDTKGDEDKLVGEGAHSLMNIPERWRVMYVPPPGHVFVAADYANQEGRAMAWLSKDPAYLQAFKDEEAGGHKVHAINAHRIFGIDPSDAKRVKYPAEGQMRTAYYLGKRLTHACSYDLMPIAMIMYKYNVTMDVAVLAYEKLRVAYATMFSYKDSLVAEVLGRWEPRLDSRGGRTSWRASCVQGGTRYLANPFGWQRWWYGMGKVVTDPVTNTKVAMPVQANEVLAFGPQSMGASVWSRVAPEVEEHYPIALGNYDNLMIVVREDEVAVREAAQLLREKMEQPWPQLGGFKFPVEVKHGYNWGDFHQHDAKCAEDGCDEMENLWGLREINV